MKGDGLQNGGLLIVRKGGELIYYHKEETPGNHVGNDEILQALGIDPGKIEYVCVNNKLSVTVMSLYVHFRISLSH